MKHNRIEKIIVTTILIIILFNVEINAQQDSSGIYLSTNDFNLKRLSYAINCKKQKHIIRANTLTQKDYLIVIHEHKKYRIQKDSVFGFKTCEGLYYRIVNKINYYIITPNAGQLILYELKSITTPKNPLNPIFKFSVGFSDNLKDLNIVNIKNILPNNHDFHNEIDAFFRADNDLLAYDSYHKQYKVLRVFEKYYKNTR